MTASPKKPGSKKPELNTTPLKIDKLINRIDEGEVKIPAFQRGYVWKQNQVIELLESIKKQYPIGSLLLWEASQKDKLRCTRNIAGYEIPDRSESWPVNYILDGQQRLSTIYAVFSEVVEQEPKSKKYNPNLDIFEIYYDFENNSFIPKEEAILRKKTAVALRNIVDPIKLVDEISNLEKAYHNDAKSLSSTFLNYEIPVIQIKNRTKEEVGVIFERINNTGTKLNILDLMTAWTWTEDFHLLDATGELLEELDEKGFGGIDQKLVLQAVSGAVIGSTKTDNILRLTGERVRDNWKRIEDAFKGAIDFLSTEIGCPHIEFLPFHQQLIPIVRFYYKNRRISSDQLNALRKFFWATTFSDRYSTGQTTAKMDTDISLIDQISDYNYKGLLKYKPSIDEKSLINTQFSKGNPTTRGFLLLAAQETPLDLTNGHKVDLGRSLSTFNRKEYHHIFPNSYLTKEGYPKNERFSVVNFCFLPSSSNKKISSKKPSDYFSSIIPSDKKDKILESNLIPRDEAIYRNNKYDEFLEKRANIILAKIAQLTS